MGAGRRGAWWRLVQWLFWHLLDVAMRRPPDLIVGTKADPYLRRWWLIPRNRFLNVYLHCFHRSDDDRALHDHPWWSLSLLLCGRYFEQTISAGGINHRREYRMGAWRRRGARFAHRVEIKPGERCWTLFITGPVIREWGFHCPTGWRSHRDFASLTNGVSGVGLGCDAPSRPPKPFWKVWREDNA